MSICRKERLTFYNFLKDYNPESKQSGSMKANAIKAQLNKEYGFYFKRADFHPFDYDYFEGLRNPLKSKFSAEY